MQPYKRPLQRHVRLVADAKARKYMTTLLPSKMLTVLMPAPLMLAESLPDASGWPEVMGRSTIAWRWRVALWSRAAGALAAEGQAARRPSHVALWRRSVLRWLPKRPDSPIEQEHRARWQIAWPVKRQPSRCAPTMAGQRKQRLPASVFAHVQRWQVPCCYDRQRTKQKAWPDDLFKEA